MSTPAPDPRIEQPGICGITRLLGHTEWICIAAAHDTEHQRSSQRSVYGYVPKAERHYLIPRFVRNDPDMRKHYDAD